MGVTLYLLFVAGVAGVSSFGILPPAENEINSTGKNGSHPDSKFNILLLHVLLPNASHGHQPIHPESNEVEHEAKNGTLVPEVEFKKLKEAALSAGLSQTKADRLARAAKLMNMTFDEIADTRKVLGNPSTSADYADKVRRSLEDVAIEHQTKGTSNNLNLQLPGGPHVSTLNSTPLYTLDSSKNSSTNGTKVDPLTLHRLSVSSELAGLKPNETQRFLRAIINSNLNSTQVNSLEKAMTHHAPTAEDLNKLADVLEGNGTRAGNETHNAKDGAKKSEAEAVWQDFPQPGSNNTHKLFARAEDSLNAKIFSATRNCGVSPEVLPKRKSNVSPGQFPWHVAILSSDDVFLCSGTLISPSIVVTTGTCIMRYKSTNFAPKIILGGWNFPTSNELCELPRLEVFARAAVFHPLFKEGKVDQAHNIGLIRLSKDVDFDKYPHIFPICIISESLVDPPTASTKCKCQGWPNLLNLNTRSTQAFLSGSDVQSKSSGCSGSTNKCVNGPACAANEGSSVICQGKTGRYYQWGIVSTPPKCSRQEDIIDLEIIGIFENYSFIKSYLFTPIPATP